MYLFYSIQYLRIQTLRKQCIKQLYPERFLTKAIQFFDNVNRLKSPLAVKINISYYSMMFSFGYCLYAP